MHPLRTNPLRWALSPILLAAGLIGCGGSPNFGPEPIDENAPIVLPEPGRQGQWAEESHVSLSTMAALKWNLPASRVNVIGPAGDDPDTYESGIDNNYNQQWSHAYLYSSLGIWVWGDANENFDDCITGRLAGQLEGPECKDGLSAKYHYSRGNQIEGDRFLGYATHYIEDVCQVLHASFPSTDMLTQHFAYEGWVKANWTAGHNFQATVAADNYYYPITDLQQAVRNAAWAASYYNSSGSGRQVWDNYRASGYPTGVGTGNAALVDHTRQLLIRASRYATGAIKYTLDTYNQWGATY
ncbi:MAG TPA: hypothetical protein VH877_24030 [Polyangia bacterium]|jgi:hypothetical protein|nr:hypothetical protein [Polyangia bacterium]